jgi:hypothetical protein
MEFLYFFELQKKSKYMPRYFLPIRYVLNPNFIFFEEVQKEKEMECVSTECSIMNAIILEKKTM